MNLDFLAAHCRRHLETINLEVPDAYALEEIIAAVIDSPYVVSHDEHDRRLDEILSDDTLYEKGYAEGHTAALEDVRSLKQSPNPEIQPGPSCS